MTQYSIAQLAQTIDMHGDELDRLDCDFLWLNFGPQLAPQANQPNQGSKPSITHDEYSELCKGLPFFLHWYQDTVYT